MPRLISGLLIVIWLPVLTVAQDQDTLDAKPLPPIEVEADRQGTDIDEAPLSISQVGKDRILQGQQQLGLNESLGPVPGVTTFNANNYAQDLRLSIRGFGARAAFGIRGVRVLVDGILESTPDGQAQVDNIDIGALQGLEVLRGPSASLYGNAAGGALLLQTEAVEDPWMIEGRATLGSFGLQRYQLKAGVKGNNWSGLVYGARTSVEGYRVHSSYEQTFVNGRFDFQPSENLELSLLAYYNNSPMAQDPGAVDFAQFYSDPQAARARNVQFNTGESVEQGRVAVKLKQTFADGGELRARAYYLDRSFGNYLPFEFGGRVNLARTYGGGGVSYQKALALSTHLGYRFQVGVDADLQRDNRQQYENLEGTEGDLIGEQLEAFSSLGAYVLNQVRLGEQWLFQANLRLDGLWLEARDRFLSDGDDSGERQYQQVNPSLGLSYQWADNQYFFGNFSTNFETPTLSELSANPDGLMGFNEELKPQQAVNFEVGLKGIALRKIRYALTWYHISLENELVPFEIAGQQGRTFFRNAGSSERIGLEAYVQTLAWKGLQFTGSYTLQSFTYLDYELDGQQFAGFELPGIPTHSYYAELAYQNPLGAFARVWWQGRSSLWADDANTILIPDANTLNARIGWDIILKQVKVQPYLGINNLTDTLYPDNVRLNAARGLYYEAGVPRSFFGGVVFRLTGE